MRYLGRVIKLVDKKQNPEVYLCLQRVIFVKSLKHIFREAMRDSEDIFISISISHLLNCILSPLKIIKLLNIEENFPDYSEYYDFDLKHESAFNNQENGDKSG